jgi:hypothetical protein
VLEQNQLASQEMMEEIVQKEIREAEEIARKKHRKVAEDEDISNIEDTIEDEDDNDYDNFVCCLTFFAILFL